METGSALWRAMGLLQAQLLLQDQEQASAGRAAVAMALGQEVEQGSLQAQAQLGQALGLPVLATPQLEVAGRERLEQELVRELKLQAKALDLGPTDNKLSEGQGHYSKLI